MAETTDDDWFYFALECAALLALAAVCGSLVGALAARAMGWG